VEAVRLYFDAVIDSETDKDLSKFTGFSSLQLIDEVDGWMASLHDFT